VRTPQTAAGAAVTHLPTHAVGEAYAYVQGASLKACAVSCLRLLNSPATREAEAMKLASPVMICALALGACERAHDSSTDATFAQAANSMANVAVAPDTDTPRGRLTNMMPPDEAAFFQAFDQHDKALSDAPNSVAREAARKTEDAKLCSVIKGFKQFKNWTAEVRSIRNSEDNRNQIIAVFSLNNSFGYLATAHVSSGSSLYPKIVRLKAGLLHGADVTISGTVIQASAEAEVLEQTGESSGAAECAGQSNFDVELTAIAPL